MNEPGLQLVLYTFGVHTGLLARGRSHSVRTTVRVKINFNTWPV